MAGTKHRHSSVLQVRRYAAEQLYTMLLMAEEAVAEGADVDAALEALSGGAWDGPLEAVRPLQAHVRESLGLGPEAALAARPPSSS